MSFRVPLIVMAVLLAALTLTSTTMAASPPQAPPRSCDTPWCKKVREVRKVALRADRTLARHGSPMAGTGVYWARSGRKWDVNPFVVLGISGKESSLGKVRCGFNVTGLGSCGRTWTSTGCVDASVRRLALWEMRDWPAAIETMVRYFPCRFPGAGSIYDLHGYCPGCSTWMDDSAYWARQFGSGPGLRWRDALR